MWKLVNVLRRNSVPVIPNVEDSSDVVLSYEWITEDNLPKTEEPEPSVFTTEEILPKIRQMGEIVQSLNQNRVDVWIDIHQRLAEEVGDALVNALLIDRWESHADPHGEDCALCKRGRRYPQYARDHIVGMLGFTTVAAIELHAETNQICVYALNSDRSIDFRYHRRIQIRPDSDTDEIAERVVYCFAEAILRYHRERIPV